MTELFSYFQHSDNMFWGNDVYRLWFYCAIMLIIVLEKRKMIKIIFGIYSIFFHLALFNPITYQLTKLFSGGAWPYYARLYSMIPLPCILALGTILLKERIIKSNGLEEREKITWGNPFKYMFTIGALALIVCGGTDVYSQDWMKPAQNLAKVPDEAIWICKELHQDGGITIAVPESLSSYIRQVDSSFYMPYGRTVNELGIELSQEFPDPDFVMKEAGREACDYVVLYDNKENRARFKACGYTPTYEIGRYLVYLVDGVPRIKKEYDKLHRSVSETYLNSEGEMSEGEGEYAQVQYEYEGISNKVLRISYYGADAKLKNIHNDEFAIIIFQRNYKGWPISTSYRNQEDEPVYLYGRYETKTEYDSEGRIIRESYYDTDKQPMIRTDNSYASRVIEYDTNGRTVGERYYDIEGNKVNNNSGFHRYLRKYAEDNAILSEAYYNKEDELLYVAYFDKQ